MRDTLPTKPWDSESAIVNLNKMSQRGSHWVAYKKRSNLVHYFDSFGNLSPPKELQEYLQGCTIRFNNDQYQNFGSVNCGHLCLRFLCDTEV